MCAFERPVLDLIKFDKKSVR